MLLELNYMKREQHSEEHSSVVTENFSLIVLSVYTHMGVES